MHKITHLLDLWERWFEGLVADGKYSPTSLDTYRRALKNHIRPTVGEIRIGEATTPRIETVLSKIKEGSGAPTALRQYGAVLGPAVLGVILTSRIADGPSMSAAVHTALIVNGVLLAIAAIVCAMTVRLGRNTVG